MDADLAFVALVIAVTGIIGVVAFTLHLVSNGSYFSAASFLFGLGAVSVVCIRDYHRGKWSVLSVVIVAIWVALTVIAAIYAAIKTFKA
jgi:hypothetical protein